MVEEEQFNEEALEDGESEVILFQPGEGPQLEKEKEKFHPAIGSGRKGQEVDENKSLPFATFNLFGQSSFFPTSEPSPAPRSLFSGSTNYPLESGLSSPWLRQSQNPLSPYDNLLTTMEQERNPPRQFPFPGAEQQKSRNPFIS